MGASITQSTQKILAVEDDREIAGLVKLHLEDTGYDVELAHDGATGLQRALDEAYSSSSWT